MPACPVTRRVMASSSSPSTGIPSTETSLSYTASWRARLRAQDFNSFLIVIAVIKINSKLSRVKHAFELNLSAAMCRTSIDQLLDEKVV